MAVLIFWIIAIPLRPDSVDTTNRLRMWGSLPMSDSTKPRVREQYSRCRRALTPDEPLTSPIPYVFPRDIFPASLLPRPMAEATLVPRPRLTPQQRSRVRASDTAINVPVNRAENFRPKSPHLPQRKQRISATRARFTQGIQFSTTAVATRRGSFRAHLLSWGGGCAHVAPRIPLPQTRRVLANLRYYENIFAVMFPKSRKYFSFDYFLAVSSNTYIKAPPGSGTHMRITRSEYICLRKTRHYS
ncbi:hypothetical protein B0H21DRAFT_107852 [Amylocystis lapponica]|nr:hypothetical protein B0H21DRAFT_107852 [Amylocystis lapponica]